MTVRFTRSKIYPALSAALMAACYLTGCGTVLTRTQLTVPVASEGPQLRATVTEVHVDVAVRTGQFDEDSRLVVALDLDPHAASVLDLRDATLQLGEDSPRPALASGVGSIPQRLNDDEWAAPLKLREEQPLRAWVAFGGFAPRRAHEIPERITLRLPDGQALALSVPGSAPLWKGQRVTKSIGFALWPQFSEDETQLNLATVYLWVAGPVVIDYHLGGGARSGSGHVPDSVDSACCSGVFGSALLVPVLQTQSLVLSPFAGVDVSIGSRHSGPYRQLWVGPVLGLDLGVAPLLPRHGPLPIDYSASPLTMMCMRVGLTHWFGKDRDYPSFGVIAAFIYNFGY